MIHIKVFLMILSGVGLLIGLLLLSTTTVTWSQDKLTTKDFVLMFISLLLWVAVMAQLVFEALRIQ